MVYVHSTFNIYIYNYPHICNVLAYIYIYIYIHRVSPTTMQYVAFAGSSSYNLVCWRKVGKMENIAPRAEFEFTFLAILELVFLTVS